MKRKLPELIERYWYSIDWEVTELWALDLPVSELPMARLDWHLDIPVWPDPAETPYRATPRQVIEKPTTHATEAARIAAADLAYPIEVILRGERWMILDGIHRLAKAWQNGADRMKVRIVPESAVRHL